MSTLPKAFQRYVPAGIEVLTVEQRDQFERELMEAVVVSNPSAMQNVHEKYAKMIGDLGSVKFSGKMYATPEARHLAAQIEPRLGTTDDDLKNFLYVYGITPTDSIITQLRVLLEALRKFGERNERYKDVWKESGWKGSLFDMRKKLTRLWRVFWRDQPIQTIDLECDDAYDLINFTAFFIRNVKDDNQWGQWG